MDVTMKMFMLSAAFVLVLGISNVFAGPLSKIKLSDNRPVQRISSEGNEKFDLNEGHHLQRRFIDDAVAEDMVGAESRFGGNVYQYHSFLPYVPTSHGPYPSAHSPHFGNAFHHFHGNQHPGGWNNHNNGPYGNHHHHHHHYDGNHHHFHHGHDYPHDHGKCQHDSSSESQSSDDIENVTKYPYPGITKPDRSSTIETVLPTTTTNSLTTIESFDIDVRLNANGK